MKLVIQEDELMLSLDNLSNKDALRLIQTTAETRDLKFLKKLNKMIDNLILEKQYDE